MEEPQEPSVLDIFAGISLPGVISRASMLDTPKDIALKAYDIAEAMIVESKRRQPECTQE